jgi:hypothetical protein
MIIKGKSRAGPAALAAHLGNAEKNEKVSLLETKGTVAQDLRGALTEMDAYAAGTRCEKSLYHAAISPEPPHRLTDEQRAEAIKTLEEKLGLTDHARVVVMHEKQGREHIHVVWSRIDLEQMRSVSDSHNYRKHEEVARDLERRFGHDRVQGAHHEREGVERPDRTPSRAELRQEERTGISGKEVKAEVTAAFRASDGPEAFKSALEDKGYQLAKGDKRDFVVIDQAGGIHSLARRIDGMKAAELREFMAPLNRENLPSTEEAKRIAEERARQEEKVRQAREAARLEADYSRGAGYVTQTTAAQKDHKRRQKLLDERTGEDRKGSKAERTDDKRRAHDHQQRREQESDEERSRGRKSTSSKSSGSKSDNKEMTEAARDRMSRLLNSERGQKQVERDDWDPDRQNTAPGGGRTRGR